MNYNQKEFTLKKYIQNVFCTTFIIAVLLFNISILAFISSLNKTSDNKLIKIEDSTKALGNKTQIKENQTVIIEHQNISISSNLSSNLFDII